MSWPYRHRPASRRRVSYFLNRPGQTGFDRRRRLVDVVAIQAQAGFQTQGVACAQTGGLDFGLRQQLLGELDGRVSGHRDLEAVFTGIAAAGDETVGAHNLERAAGHEGQLLDAWRQALQRVDGVLPLQSEQRAIRQRHHLAAVGDVCHQVPGVGVLARRVDDDEKIVGPPRNHQIVEDAAGRIGEEGVALLADRKVDHVHRHQRFERGGGAVADQPQLAHVRDIEQRRLLAAMAVLGNDAAGVVDRHLVAGKGHHLCAELDMQVEQRCAVQGRGHDANLPRAVDTTDSTSVEPSCPRCPLYLRD